ncbi:MAG: cobalt-precorrin-6A reductase [Beijerinckiaceae bacterium]|nr:cobalt-precorrin-6A reductase [Beijerinckiaceae bacterium]MCI0736776.1 cobalt-precorrin-6A reductase [Beijerinckiaceae bacterium]
MMRVLVLGGTWEANKLAHLLAMRSEISSILSFAGRTKAVIAPPIPYRVGGFGGVEGLTAYLEAENIGVLIDATHPFAGQISRHAEVAAARAKIPLIVLSRPAWVPEQVDNWIDAADMAAAAMALGTAPRRVFLTIGRLQIEAFAAAPQHYYLIRTIEPLTFSPSLPDYRIIHGRGPFAVDSEEKILRKEAIETLVTKNSGGEAAFAKILAARKLGLPVVMVARPRQAARAALHDPAEAMDVILRHRAALRGV